MTSISDQSIQDIYARFIGPELSSPEHPVVYAMCGIPGAGKSSFVKQMQEKGTFPAQAFVLNPDLVMEALPVYHQLESELGAEKAFKELELPARDLAYGMLQMAQDRKLHIIKDMGCTRQENIDKLSDLKAAGYQLDVFYIDVQPVTAFRRIQNRERHTPPEMVTERYQALATIVPQLMVMADHFIHYNNDQDNQFCVQTTSSAQSK